MNLPEEENTPQKRVDKIFKHMDKVFYVFYSFLFCFFTMNIFSIFSDSSHRNVKSNCIIFAVFFAFKLRLTDK